VAEQYPPGVNRIFYKSTGFKEGLEIQVDILYPNMGNDAGIFLTEVGGGLYYFDYNFPAVGIYAAVFWENGIKRGAQVYNIKGDFEGTVTVVRGGDRGPGVINL